uniref:helix-turn-helix domain-containing protein n=1 Tax=Loigolactobacillus zhaoyuanensis TaxID=2486017 RepID=UPI00384B4181
MKTYSYNRQENKRVGAFMTQYQSTMSSHYRQLQFDERGQIEVLHNQGLSIRMIAEIVRRSPSTISRELRR